MFLLPSVYGALVKSTNNSIAWRFFLFWRIVKICDVVDRFLRKPFCFFLRIFSIWGSIRLSKRALKILVGYSLVVFGNSEVIFLGKWNDVALCPSVYCVLVIHGVVVLEQLVVEFPCLPYLWWYIIKTGRFPVFDFH